MTYTGTNGHFTIIPILPNITFDKSSISGYNGSIISCPVSLTNYWVDPIALCTITVNGTAYAGINYVPVCNMVVLASYGYRCVNGLMVFDGNKVVCQPVQLLDKNYVSNLTFYLNLTNPSGLQIGATSSLEIKINEKPVQEQTIYNLSLVEGWNLISLPILSDDNTISRLFSRSAIDSIIDIWGWDESTQNWVYYSPDPDDYFKQYYQQITGLETGKAYWVETNRSVSITIQGTVPVSTPACPVTLVSGWNFVGLSGLSSSDMASLFPEAIDIWGWDESAQNWVYYSPNTDDYFKQYYPGIDNLQPGHGYWVEMP